MDIAEIHRFKNQIVRDLAWVIASPPVFNSINSLDVEFISESECLKEYELNRDLLLKLDTDPAPLQNHIYKTSSHLLGKYFESLVEFWLSHTPSKKLLASNLQIFHEDRTIGELDFIYKDLATGEVIHIEAAGKFYMAVENKPTWQNFIGPNTNDRMDIKLHKMTDHQTKLIHHHKTKHTIKSNGISQPEKAKIFYKGYSFFHYDLYIVGKYVLPDSSNPNHFTGWWLRASKLGKLKDNKNKWMILERMTWISKTFNPQQNLLLEYQDLLRRVRNYFENNNYPLLVSEIDNENRLEISRGFIVATEYPNIEMNNLRDTSHGTET